MYECMNVCHGIKCRIKLLNCVTYNNNSKLVDFLKTVKQAKCEVISSMFINIKVNKKTIKQIMIQLVYDIIAR